MPLYCETFIFGEIGFFKIWDSELVQKISASVLSAFLFAVSLACWLLPTQFLHLQVLQQNTEVTVKDTL